MGHLLNLPRLRASIERNEGRRRRAYRDTEGVLTVGVGHNLEVEHAAGFWSDFFEEHGIT